MKNFTSFVFLLLLTVSGHFALGNTVFYSQDFSSGIPGTWQNDDSAGYGVVWRLTTTGAANSNPYGIPTSLSTSGTSSANGFVIVDGDSAGSLGQAQNTWLISEAINCTGKMYVHLTFNELYAHFADDSGIVFLSTDGVTWTDIYHAETGLNQNEYTPNPTLVDIDISAWADNQATVYVAFNYRGGWDWYWMVDDVELYEQPAADGGTISIDSPTNSCTLLSSAEQIMVMLKNFGADSISNFAVYYQVDTNAVVTETVTDTVVNGGTYSYTFTTTVDLSAPGLHTITVYTGVSGDGDALNDTVRITIYNGPHPVNSLVSYTNGFEMPEDTVGWKAFDANNDTVIWGLSSILPYAGNLAANFVHNLPNNGDDDWFFSTCLGLEQTTVDSMYKLDFYYRTFSPSTQANMEVKLFASQDTTSPVATIVPTTNVTFITNNYQQSSTLFAVPSAGTYYIGWHVTNVSGYITSLKLDDINLQLGHFTGQAQLAAKSNEVVLYPNPTNGMFYLANLKGFESPVQVTVFDMMGKAVYNNTVREDKLAIDLAGQSAGVYTVRLSNEKQVLTKLISVTK